MLERGARLQMSSLKLLIKLTSHQPNPKIGAYNITNMERCTPPQSFSYHCALWSWHLQYIIIFQRPLFLSKSSNNSYGSLIGFQSASRCSQTLVNGSLTWLVKCLLSRKARLYHDTTFSPQLLCLTQVYLILKL